MKKAYNEAWIRALSIQSAARRWQRKGLLSTDQVRRIGEAFPEGFYKANVWVKIALFLFTFLLNGCATGLTSALFLEVLENSTAASGVVALLYGVAFALLLDYFIRERKLYHSGIDNALLYSVVIAFTGGLYLLFGSLLDAGENVFLFGLLALPALGWGVARYASRLLTVLAFSAALFTVVTLAALSFWGKLLLPFVGMAVGATVYFLVKRARQRDAFFYWHDCLIVAEVLALVVFYACGNVWVVRSGGQWLLGSATVPFAPLFYALTALVPLGYVGLGLYQRDRYTLVVGLLATATSVLTFQEMVIHLDWGLFLALSGAGTGALAWVGIRYFDPERSGFTSVRRGGIQQSDAEVLATTQVEMPHAQPVDPLFGGGSFGGGGAGAGY